MLTVRNYRQSDSGPVGRLISDTYSQFNLSFATPEQRDALLGPFRHARSPQKAHQEAIAQAIRADMVFVVEDEGAIVAVLRGRKERLQSLFVLGDYHRLGIGRVLVEHFERACLDQGATSIKVAATLYAVPFYLKLGYKKSTGVRPCWSFGGRGLTYQPMKKILV